MRSRTAREKACCPPVILWKVPPRAVASFAIPPPLSITDKMLTFSFALNLLGVSAFPPRLLLVFLAILYSWLCFPGSEFPPRLLLVFLALSCSGCAFLAVFSWLYVPAAPSPRVPDFLDTCGSSRRRHRRTC